MKTTPKSAKQSTKVLRERAEAKLKKQTSDTQSPSSDYEAKKMLHELQVHQIELEMQNEELKQARITERLYYRYTELFEFAPIAYFVFDLNGMISQVNLRGASLLGIDRDHLVGKPFSHYVTAQYREIFKRCLGKAFSGSGIQSCEVLGQVSNNTLWLDIEANLGITGTDCLAAMIDISDRKQAEDSQNRANKELAFQNQEKDKRADELVLANADKEQRANELALANIELAFQNQEKDKRADELVLANADKEQRANELALANIELAFQNQEKDKRADELVLANAEKEQRVKQLALAAKVFTHARESIMITDAEGLIIEVNKTFSDITGYSREEAIGKTPRILKSERQSPEFYVDMWQAIVNEGYWYGEIWNHRKNNEVYAVMQTISAVRDANGITTHYVSLASDITPMKQHQEQLERIAHYDVLTNLPNRVLLADRLSQAMLQCRRHGQSLAVVFLDLDGFKTVNDAYGHDIGDELLIALSIRMKEALREGDSLSRIGGDEFVAVLADLAKVEDCEPVLERLLLAASEPVTVSGVVLNISASIGVTLYPRDNVDADLLMRHADQAMYMAKESGKNRYHLFDTAQDDAVKVQRESLEAIRYALDHHQFVLYYQPKVNMKIGTVVGVEALIRWQHPERGLLSPIEFLPVIENHTMMIEIGEWVIDTALTQIGQWQAMALDLPVSTSVNIAAVQLMQPGFIQTLTDLLAAHPNVEPRYLELEMLETSALEDVNHVSIIMNDCMSLGVHFALDDFGTGYSSLTYLRRLPASLIKIDQSFVKDMLSNIDDFAIVEGVIALAKSFKRDVIAEGVETVEHGTALLQLGCELAQGYGIARPMPACDIPAWMNNWKPDASWQ
ncbi:EAL domain-containing protein [Shewanella vesiculosa]|uniref:sensor domain-containing protein n=1 Tax=Shewanella vesiculosa TaxID=518738 RepID=UPI000F4E9BA3|nr:EAL domain-containing protein [Shewanella vesiculosa]RPA54996.1 EAL domain-containing protein [Shewanella vesiculosa]UJL44001.1 EAL domain-containing protein [Shewanella vesiculosa]